MQACDWLTKTECLPQICKDNVDGGREREVSSHLRLLVTGTVRWVFRKHRLLVYKLMQLNYTHTLICTHNANLVIYSIHDQLEAIIMCMSGSLSLSLSLSPSLPLSLPFSLPLHLHTILLLCGCMLSHIYVYPHTQPGYEAIPYQLGHPLFTNVRYLYNYNNISCWFLYNDLINLYTVQNECKVLKYTR